MSNTTNCIIVINAGSSSLKFKIFQEHDLKDLTSGQISGIGTEKTKIKIKDNENKTILDDLIPSSSSRDEILIYLLDTINNIFPNISISMIGHRVVHGGIKYSKPVLVNDEVIDYLKSIAHMAPLHNPHNIKPMEIFQQKYPNIKQVACFDTAFHATNPNYAKYYPLPRDLLEKDHIIRYGFHGLSYQYISLKMQEISPNEAKGKVVICHLGAGASLAAVVNGVGLTTTMGFTPLEGVPMGTRSGSIDPAILLYLMNNKGYSSKDLEELLFYKSGILGVSEESSDFYTIEISDKPSSKEAWRIFIHGVVKQIGSMIAAMDGIDAMVFTAGVGENSSKLRKDIADSLTYLGIKLDDKANSSNGLVVSTPESKVKILVIPTQEELMIAKHCLSLK